MEAALTHLQLKLSDRLEAPPYLTYTCTIRAPVHLSCSSILYIVYSHILRGYYKGYSRGYTAR